MHRLATQVSRRRPMKVVVGPDDHGRRMTMAEFARTDSLPGFHYELNRGVIEVTNIPDFFHNLAADRIHKAIHLYDAKRPGIVQFVGGSFASKIELWGSATERHPDLSIYLTPPPPGVRQPWDQWVPEIVVEVVSASSAKRDYEDKPHDYLAAGVREYWIVDPQKRNGLFRTRRADTWVQKRVGPRGRWSTTLLPGFELTLGQVFAAVRK